MIRVEGLFKTYDGARAPVLRDVTLSVDRGDVLWVSGPSGAGKSTLLNVLGLLTSADAGQYFIDGVEMLSATRAVRLSARRDAVSTIFQRGNLFGHLSALDNVLVGMATDDVSHARRQLEAVGLGEKADQLAGLLSGGEQERVAIARAVARGTRILLADEPVAGLDAANASTVMALLTAAARGGVAVVVVSHDERTSSIASSVLRLGQP